MLNKCLIKHIFKKKWFPLSRYWLEFRKLLRTSFNLGKNFICGNLFFIFRVKEHLTSSRFSLALLHLVSVTIWGGWTLQQISQETRTNLCALLPCAVLLSRCLYSHQVSRCCECLGPDRAGWGSAAPEGSTTRRWWPCGGRTWTPGRGGPLWPPGTSRGSPTWGTRS